MLFRSRQDSMPTEYYCTVLYCTVYKKSYRSAIIAAGNSNTVSSLRCKHTGMQAVLCIGQSGVGKGWTVQQSPLLTGGRLQPALRIMMRWQGSMRTVQHLCSSNTVQYCNSQALTEFGFSLPKITCCSTLSFKKARKFGPSLRGGIFAWASLVLVGCRIPVSNSTRSVSDSNPSFSNANRTNANQMRHSKIIKTCLSGTLAVKMLSLSCLIPSIDRIILRLGSKPGAGGAAISPRLASLLSSFLLKARRRGSNHCCDTAFMPFFETVRRFPPVGLSFLFMLRHKSYSTVLSCTVKATIFQSFVRLFCCKAALLLQYRYDFAVGLVALVCLTCSLLPHVCLSLPFL